MKSPIDGTPVRLFHMSCISGSVSQPHRGKKPDLMADSVSRQPPLHRIAQLYFGELISLSQFYFLTGQGSTEVKKVNGSQRKSTEVKVKSTVKGHSVDHSHYESP